jgi:hypothetical protein
VETTWETVEDAPIGGQKHKRYNASPAGKARRTEYRRSKSKWTTDAEYLSRPFIAWDGEGITDPLTGEHRYVLLANSLGETLVDPDGLSWGSVANMLFRCHTANPKSIHIGFGLGYDVNCWIADLSREHVEKIAKTRRHNVQGWRVSWRPGKSFYLSPSGLESGGMTVYDVLPFFQRPFVAACDEYLGTEWEGREEVIADKARRGSFTLDDLPRVTEYNAHELRTLVRLAEELRYRLNKVTLRPARWDGPGAVATALMKREGVKDAKAVVSEEVARAARYAYAGGRFEMVQWGTRRSGPETEGGPAAYEYDVNSAYPTALRHVPNLQRGEWVRNEETPFTLYRLHYVGETSEFYPQPLFCRHENGTVSYPGDVTGWYWTPEYEAACEYVARNGGRLEVLETHAFRFDVDDPESYPFRFIDPLYQQRRALKAAGDGAHVGIKLGLNSLYGKLAQQVGWMPATDKDELRIPPYHQLEWAGYTTSYCRAAVLRAVTPILSSVIAFETDAVFTTQRAAVDVGSDLGQWEETWFDWLCYVQSGMYFGQEWGTEKRIDKTRGIDRGSLTYEEVRGALASENASDRTVSASLTRFVGARIALAQSWDRWRHWEKMPKQIRLGPSGKRAHYEFGCCRSGKPSDCLHWSVVPFLAPMESCEFPIAWINPDPNMSELEELRNMPGWEELEW